MVTRLERTPPSIVATYTRATLPVTRLQLNSPASLGVMIAVPWTNAGPPVSSVQGERVVPWSSRMASPIGPIGASAGEASVRGASGLQIR